MCDNALKLRKFRIDVYIGEDVPKILLLREGPN